ncbi:MAG: dTMP kinase [Thermoproteota archaeon]|nr:dTMP kinase [Thermoproteota archaeon]
MVLIAFEGIDKSGKGTQAELLFRRLKAAGRGVECIEFPDYRTPLGREIRLFLSGRVEFSPEVRQFLYVANRWERKKDIDLWLREGKIVVADRYIPSGLAYGLANDLDLNWMMQLEEKLPTADVVVIIDVAVETSLKRCDPEKRDVYEKNKPFLEKVRKNYLSLAKKLNWIVVDGEGSAGEVAERVWKSVSKQL